MRATKIEDILQSISRQNKIRSSLNQKDLTIPQGSILQRSTEEYMKVLKDNRTD